MQAGTTTVWEAFERPELGWEEIISHISTLWDENMMKFHKIPMTFVAGYGDRVKQLADFMFEFNKNTEQDYKIFDIHLFVALGSRGQIHDKQLWDFNNLIWQVKGDSEIAFYDPGEDDGKAKVLKQGDLIYINPKTNFSIKPISEGCYVSFAMKKFDT